MYKGVKYNIILIFLMIIIGVLGATSTGMLNSNPDSDSIFDEVPVDDDQQSDNDAPPGSGGFVMPGADANAYERLAFGIKVFAEGAGFQYTRTQEVNSLGMIQKIYSQGYRGGNKDLYEEWQYADFPQGKNEFLSYYSDGINMQGKYIRKRADFSYQNKSYNFAKADEKIYSSVADYSSVFGKLNDSPLTLNSSTTSLLKYDKRSDPSNYIIKLNITISKIGKEYYSTFEANGASNVKFLSSTYEFKISKTTGYITRIFSEETFTTTYAGLNVQCDSRAVQIFSNINRSAESKISEIASKSFA